MKSLYLLCCVVLALHLGGCGDKEAPKVPPALVKSSSAKTTPAPAPPQILIKSKLQAYIDCFNTADESAHRTIDRYRSWVIDMQAGPTGREQNIYGLYDIHESTTEKCRQVVAAGAALTPAMPDLDFAAVNYDKALAALGVTVRSIEPYYSREDYKDDNFAKGKQAHPEVVASFLQFLAASEVLSRSLDAASDELSRLELVEVERTEERIRRVRDKAPYTRNELVMLEGIGAMMVSGSKEKSRNQYNQLVAAHNRD